jgi:NHS family xanthosine MFS transporter
LGASFWTFAYGNPGDGLWMIIMSCVVYGMAFDFFNISGSLFIETTTDFRIRSSAQGLFMMMSNGFGAFFGIISGIVIDKFFTQGGVRDWHNIWLSFAGSFNYCNCFCCFLSTNIMRRMLLVSH